MLFIFKGLFCLFFFILGRLRHREEDSKKKGILHERVHRGDEIKHRGHQGDVKHGGHHSELKVGGHHGARQSEVKIPGLRQGEVKPGGHHEEVKPGGHHEEVKPGGHHEEVKPGGHHEEVKHGCQHGEHTGCIFALLHNKICILLFLTLSCSSEGSPALPVFKHH